MSFPPQKAACNEPENDNPSSPPLPPKRTFTSTDEVDHTSSSPGYFKRRHVHNDGEATKRAPLEVDNRPQKDPKRIPKNGTKAEGIWSWLLALQSSDADTTAGSSLSERLSPSRGARYNSDVRESIRALTAGSAPGWPSPSRSQYKLTSSERRASSRERNVDKVTQPIRLCTPSIPYVLRSRDLRKAEASSNGPMWTVYGLMDNRDSIFDTSATLGLTKRRVSVPDMTGSCSCSLTSDSLACSADEPSKCEQPIGAEQSRVVSMTRRRCRSLPPAKLQLSPSRDAGNSTRRRHFRLDSIGTWHGTYLPGDPLTCGILEKRSSDLPITSREFYRLLRQAHYNKHASHVFSPLNPLRNPRPSSALTNNVTYQYFFPSIQDIPDKSKFKKGPEQRRRALCERRQSLVVASECRHCQHCERDTLCKRLLVSDYRRRMRLAASKLSTTPIVDKPASSPDYKIDEDEQGLWKEVTAVTSTEPSPGRRDPDNLGENNDYPEIPDEEDAKLGTGNSSAKA